MTTFKEEQLSTSLKNLKSVIKEPSVVGRWFGVGNEEAKEYLDEMNERLINGLKDAHYATIYKAAKEFVQIYEGEDDDEI